MIIKKVFTDGRTDVWGEITNYIVTDKRISSDGAIPPDDGPTLRMFRGTDVQTYGPFDTKLDYEAWFYIMNDEGKTIDGFDHTSFKFSAKAMVR